MLILMLVAVVTMFEVFGRSEKRFNIQNLMRIHRLNGRVYIALFFFVAYFCITFIMNTKSEPSPRATFHGVFSLTVLALLCLKISFVRFYRQFYGHVKLIGILIALITFGMIATSGGYYLLITGFGTEISLKRIPPEKKEIPEKHSIIVKTDAESVRKGSALYESKCSFCHDPYSSTTVVGPGHKGILKNPVLPVSKKQATPENIANQLRNPYKDMPSFSSLSQEEVLNIIAFLNTL
jgi:cytochrome c2